MIKVTWQCCSFCCGAYDWCCQYC